MARSPKASAKSSGKGRDPAASSRGASSRTSRSRSQIPGKAGEERTFKAVQTTTTAKSLRWIGAPELRTNRRRRSDVTAAGGPLQDVAGSEADAPKASQESGDPTASEEGSLRPVSSSSSSDSTDKGFAIAALVVAVIALLVAAAAVLGARRRRGVKIGAPLW